MPTAASEQSTPRILDGGKSVLPAPLIFIVLILLVYSNTFQASWHLDDYPKILHNPNAHLTSLDPSSVYATFFIGGDKGTKLYRPVPSLSLALNWFFGRDNVSGYHVVNVIIHIFATILLYHVILTLLDTPRLRTVYKDRKFLIAFLAAALWSLNPIQTQAVTYIVQRMASMAALFYLLAIYAYLKARQCPRGAGRRLWFGAVVVWFLFALGSKENAIMLPLSLLLIEILFFQDTNRQQLKSLITKTVIIGLIILGAGLVLMSIWKGNPLAYMHRLYAERSFSPSERLITQPRILLLYLSQLFYPIPARLSIEHDITVSTGFMTPWTTLPALLLVLGLIAFGISQIRKRPLLAFAVLYFFLNHLIEASILPLEMVFEHRNYLPSMFLFVPAAVWLTVGIETYRSRQRLVYGVLAAAVPLVLIALGMGTYVRNMAWSTEQSLWTDAMHKAPRLARPYYNLAKHHFKKEGRLEEALAFYQRAYTAEAPYPAQSRALALNGMASIYYIKKQYAEVVQLCQRALKQNPQFDSAMNNTAMAYIHLGDWHAAGNTLDRLLQMYPGHPRYLNLKGFVLIKQRSYRHALDILRTALRRNPHLCQSNLYLGKAFGLTGHYDRGEWYLRRARSICGNEIGVMLHLIENRLLAGDNSKAQFYATDLLAKNSIGTVMGVIEENQARSFSLPLDNHDLALFLADELQHRAVMFPSSEPSRIDTEKRR